MLEEELGQKVVITYKPGAGGAVGWSELVRQKPDGYYMAGINIPHIILQPLANDDTGYRTDQIEPIVIFQSTPVGLAVRKDSGIRSLEEFIEKAKEKLGLAKDEEAETDDAVDDEAALEEEFEEAPGGGNVTVSVDQVTLLPGALASGTVTFSDGVTDKWVVDQYGRPGFTEVSKPGYRPSPGDAQAFMQELSVALQRRGF